MNSRCNAVFGVHKIRTAVPRMYGIKIRPVSRFKVIGYLKALYLTLVRSKI